MIGLSFLRIEPTAEFRTSIPTVDRPTVPTAAWTGVAAARRIPIAVESPAPSYDPVALLEEGERWDGLS